MLCSMVEVYQFFEGKYCPRLQGQRINQASIEQSAVFCLLLARMVILLFDTEDRHIVFFQNTFKLISDYKVSHLRR
jgi:hypothetical protein